MDMEILEENKNAISFRLKGVDLAVANAVRRAAINSVSTFALDRITFYENSSPMFDEYIAHRAGLVPLTTPSKGYSETDEILFTCDVTGPKTIYSHDLETSDKSVKVAIEDIPIIKLGDEQHVRMEAKAVMGTALKHAKFQPGLVTFEQRKDDTFDFYVETFGQMPPREIIIKALGAIKVSLKEIDKKVSKL
ncbi:MAG: DNA-directed RNA polymerase subunit D [Candidatus Micrarchaeota archaeon]|nr:DNA-directed RNA polymerase subunit D [Candidatus Micrarchaeota archaeon]